MPRGRRDAAGRPTRRSTTRTGSRSPTSRRSCASGRWWPGIDGAGRGASRARHPMWKPGDHVILNGWGVGETPLGLPRAEGAPEGRLAGAPAAELHRRARPWPSARRATPRCCARMALEREGVTPGPRRSARDRRAAAAWAASRSRSSPGVGYRVVASTGKLARRPIPQVARRRRGHRSRRRSRSPASRCRRSAGRAWSIRSAATRSPMPARRRMSEGVVAACGLAQGMDLPARSRPSSCAA